MNVTPLPALADNYIWLLHDGRQALVADPGQAQPVLDALRQQGLALAGILVTHHHGDHTGGVQALRQATGAPVWGPAREALPTPCQPVRQGDVVQAAGWRLNVLDVPGHTAGHIAFFAPDVPGGPLLLCGDTLFSGGCGRIFEGTPAQMLASLDKLAALPPHTRVCAAHEYTLSNLRFARQVESHNAALADYQARCEQLRANGSPTLPSLLALERAVNPFLRSRHPDVVRAVQARFPHVTDDEVAVFAALREWKNQFK